MLKFLSLLIACMTFAMPANAQDRTDRRRQLLFVVPTCVDTFDPTACIDAELEKFAACNGTVEERLACLERKVLKQTEEIFALRRRLDERTLPRVSPLTGLKSPD